MASASQPAVYPAGLALALLSFVTLILDIGPMVWHANHRNLAATTLIAWIIYLLTTNVLNVILWPNDNYVPGKTYNGSGVCDVEVKLMVASYTALPSTFAVIMHNLAKVMDPENVVLAPSTAQKRRNLAIDLLLIWAVPIFNLATHYVVQPNRYILISVSGCVASMDESWLSIVLIFIWPPIFMLIDCYYAMILLTRLHAYRRTMHLLLTTHNTNKSRFLRLTLMSLIFVIILTPLQFYVFYNNLVGRGGPFSWNATHNPKTWDSFVWQLSHGNVYFDRWIRIVAGMLIFVFFGVGGDACVMYRRWLVACGFGRIFPGLTKPRTFHRPSHGSSPSPSSAIRSSFETTRSWSYLIGGKAKGLFTYKKWSLRSPGGHMRNISNATSSIASTIASPLSHRSKASETVTPTMAAPKAPKATGTTKDVDESTKIKAHGVGKIGGRMAGLSAKTSSASASVPSYSSRATQTEELPLYFDLCSPVEKHLPLTETRRFSNAIPTEGGIGLGIETEAGESSKTVEGNDRAVAKQVTLEEALKKI